MPWPGNLSLKRAVFALVASPLLGGFAWGVLHPPSGWESFIARCLNGALAGIMSLILMFVRPDRVPSWPYIGIAFLLLLLLALRLPRSTPDTADRPGREA